MLEKSGAVVLTDEDVKKSEEGVVTKRVQETWGLNIEELQEVVKSKDYKITNDK
jgi:hypothetical protein